MKKILVFAGAIALSIIPTPGFSGEVEQKEMMSVSEKLLPQIGEKYYYLNKKEKKAYKKNLLKYLKKVEKLEPTGVGEAFSDEDPFGIECGVMDGCFSDEDPFGIEWMCANMGRC